MTFRPCPTPLCMASLVPRPRPSTRERTLVDFLGVSNHVTHAYAHAHFSNKRVIRELRIVSCPGGGVWVAVTREFERDNCVISEILQSDWTIPNRLKFPRPSFVRESREGLGPRLMYGSLRQDTVVCKWLLLNQAHRWFVAKCVRRIIEFYIMLRTPVKLLLLGSYYDPVSR